MAALIPPQFECPNITMCFTLRISTEYYITELRFMSVGLTILGMFR